MIAENEGTAWLKEFERREGRPLRVLHIGNIANNAYINAKIQRRIGIEADVCCYEYFHIMGCPEWEDADFAGDVKDQFFPDWWAVDLKGFERPRWFAQGRLRTCIRYLHAVRRSDGTLRWLLWRQLRLELWLRCRSTLFARAVAALTGVVRGPAVSRPRLRSAEMSETGAEESLVTVELFLLWLARMVLYAIAWVTWRFRVSFIGRVRRGAALSRWAVRLLGVKSIALGRAAAALGRGRGWRTAGLMLFPTRLAHLAAPAEPLQHLEIADAVEPEEAVALLEEIETPDALAELYASFFEDTRPPLSQEDYIPYVSTLAQWQALLAEYDVVQGYALDGIVPLVAGHSRFVAYEHGTIRDIPFEDSARGRVCSLVYRAAPVVFVTNSDVLPSARRLGIESERIVFMPHAVDSDRLRRWRLDNENLRASGEGPISIISPTRHDWADADPVWAKGNDRLIHGVARARDAGVDCRLTLVEWGRHVQESKELIAALGLDWLVTWVPTMRKEALWQAYVSHHAVVDQFLTPAMGSVAFESLALGCRVITALDVETVEEFFGEMPPMLNCFTADDVAAAIEAIARDPRDERCVGTRAADWFERRHSSERILELQLGAYSRLI